MCKNEVSYIECIKLTETISLLILMMKFDCTFKHCERVFPMVFSATCKVHIINSFVLIIKHDFIKECVKKDAMIE